MFKHLSATGLLGLALTHRTFASEYSSSLITENAGGDSIANADIDALDALAKTSNMAFADLPEFPQFVNLRKYEGMQYSADDILEDLVREQDLDLDTVKRHEKFSEIEKILKGIADELSNEDDDDYDDEPPCKYKDKEYHGKKCLKDKNDFDYEDKDDSSSELKDKKDFEWKDKKKFFDDDHYEYEDEENEPDYEYEDDEEDEDDKKKFF